MVYSISSSQGNQNCCMKIAVTTAGAAALGGAAGAVYGMSRIPYAMNKAYTEVRADKTVINGLNGEEKKAAKNIIKLDGLGDIKRILDSISHDYCFNFKKLTNNIDQKIEKLKTHLPEKYMEKEGNLSQCGEELFDRVTKTLNKESTYLILNKAQAAIIKTPALYAAGGALSAGLAVVGLHKLISHKTTSK